MKRFKFPSPFTVLYIIIILSALATWLLPAGSFDTLAYDADQKIFLVSGNSEGQLPAKQETLDSLGLNMELSKFEEGKIRRPISIPDTYNKQESAPQGLKEILYAPIKGIYESIDIILFVLIIGGFIGVFQHSGALDKGVGLLAKRMEGKEKWLIISLILLIAIGGTTFGMQEETIAFYPILVPIFLAAGYDLIVPVAAVYGGSCIGLMGALINPFGTIIASDAAGVSWTEGIESRIAMLILGSLVLIWYIVRYAEKVKLNPETSILHGLGVKNPFQDREKSAVEGKMTTGTWVLLVLFALTFAVMIYGVSSLGWWFEEMTALFLLAAIILGIVQRATESDFVSAFVNGAKDLLGVSLIIGVARGITIVLNDGLISGTLLDEASNLVSGTSPLVFLPVLMMVFFVLAFFISSSSGLALVSMPIMGALGVVVGVPTEEIVNAYLFGFGLMQFITPSGLILPSLAMVNVPYNIWLKFVVKPVIPLAFLGALILIVGYLV